MDLAPLACEDGLVREERSGLSSLGLRRWLSVSNNGGQYEHAWSSCSEKNEILIAFYVLLRSSYSALFFGN